MPSQQTRYFSPGSPAFTVSVEVLGQKKASKCNVFWLLFLILAVRGCTYANSLVIDVFKGSGIPFCREEYRSITFLWLLWSGLLPIFNLTPSAFCVRQAYSKRSWELPSNAGTYNISLPLLEAWKVAFYLSTSSAVLICHIFIFIQYNHVFYQIEYCLERSLWSLLIMYTIPTLTLVFACSSWVTPPVVDFILRILI